MTLGVSYEQYEGSWYIIWHCKKTKDVLGEVKLGDKEDTV